MASGISAFAEVALPVAVHGSFTYAIPEELRDFVRLGSRVEVPLGSKLTTGFVVGLPDEAPAEAAKIKKVRSVLDDDEPALIPEIIDLCRWAAEYYIAPFGEMLRVALPANMSARGRREAIFVGTDEAIEEALAQKRILAADADVARQLQNRPLMLSALFAEAKVPRSAIERLRDAGLITIADKLTDAKGVRYDRFVVLETTGEALPPKQQAAVERLQSRGGELSVRVLEDAGVSAAVLGALAKKGIVRIERRARRHTLDAFLAGLDAESAGEINYSEH